jgi:hypothetical protein
MNRTFRENWHSLCAPARKRAVRKDLMQQQEIVAAFPNPPLFYKLYPRVHFSLSL